MSSKLTRPVPQSDSSPEQPKAETVKKSAIAKTGPKQAIAPQQIDGFAAPDVPAPIVPPQAVYDATYQETFQLAQSLGDVRKQAVVDALKDNAEAIKRDADSFRADNLQGFADWLIGG